MQADAETVGAVIQYMNTLASNEQTKNGGPTLSDYGITTEFVQALGKAAQEQGVVAGLAETVLVPVALLVISGKIDAETGKAITVKLSAAIESAFTMGYSTAVMADKEGLRGR